MGLKGFCELAGSGMSLAEAARVAGVPVRSARRVAKRLGLEFARGKTGPKPILAGRYGQIVELYRQGAPLDIIEAHTGASHGSITRVIRERCGASRRPRLSDAQVATVVEALRLGATRREAAALVGCSLATVGRLG